LLIIIGWQEKIRRQPLKNMISSSYQYIKYIMDSNYPIPSFRVIDMVDGRSVSTEYKIANSTDLNGSRREVIEFKSSCTFKKCLTWAVSRNTGTVIFNFVLLLENSVLIDNVDFANSLAWKKTKQCIRKFLKLVFPIYTYISCIVDYYLTYFLLFSLFPWSLPPSTTPLPSPRHVRVHGSKGIMDHH
jgi:hypothetical protein